MNLKLHINTDLYNLYIGRKYYTVHATYRYVQQQCISNIRNALKSLVRSLRGTAVLPSNE